MVGYMQTRDAGLALDSVRWICQEKTSGGKTGKWHLGNGQGQCGCNLAACTNTAMPKQQH